jgi:hypothetical protein
MLPGPLVFEVPAGPTAGGFTDFWQRPITDSGQTGPDKGMGGKYLILGPDDPDMKPEGYYVFRSPTVNVWSAHRVLDPDPVKAKALIDALRIYPYSQGGNPGRHAMSRRQAASGAANNRAASPTGKASPRSSTKSPFTNATA